jgi:hypothetical protein
MVPEKELVPKLLAGRKVQGRVSVKEATWSRINAENGGE